MNKLELNAIIDEEKRNIYQEKLFFSKIHSLKEIYDLEISFLLQNSAVL